MKTRCKDKTGTWIYEGDILHVEEYPDRYVGGSYDFEGVVVIENGRAKCRSYYAEFWYSDISESVRIIHD